MKILADPCQDPQRSLRRSLKILEDLKKIFTRAMHLKFTTPSRYRLQRKNSTYYSENLKSIATPDGTSLLNTTNSSLAFSNRLKTSISTSQSFVPERARVNLANCVRV